MPFSGPRPRPSSGGTVSFVPYVTDRHEWLLDTTRYYLDAVHAAGDGPYALAICPSPDAYLASFATALNSYTTEMDGFNPLLANSFWENLFSNSTTAIDAALDDSYIDNDMTDLFMDGAIADADDGFALAAIEDGWLEEGVDDMDDSFVADRVDDTFIAASVSAYESVLKQQFIHTTLVAFKGAMAMQGAIGTSTFTVGESILWKQFFMQVAEYESDLRNKLIQDRINTRRAMLDIRLKNRSKIINDRMQERIDLLVRRVTLRNEMILTRNQLREIAEQNRAKGAITTTTSVVAYSQKYLSLLGDLLNSNFRYTQLGVIGKREEYETNTYYVVSDWLWHLTIMQTYANFISAPRGGAMMPEAKQDDGMAFFSGALTGGTLGWYAGSWFPIVGNVAGAIVGGLIGGFASLFMND